jgi:hypothetical protein
MTIGILGALMTGATTLVRLVPPVVRSRPIAIERSGSVA